MENANSYRSNRNFLNTNHKDYSVVKTPARIAIYDDLKSPPRILTIQPGKTNEYIEDLASTIYKESQNKGGKVPYTAIREVSENFIHADFSEIVVSILDNGNTIRFTDQGPGFSDIENAKLPGFTSATEPMKQYIRGVGSGLPTVKEYMDYSNGYIKIENNLDNGAVITISLLENLKKSFAFSDKDKEDSNIRHQKKMQKLSPDLKPRQQRILLLLLSEGILGITDISNYTNIAISTVHKDISELESFGLIEKVANKKRMLTDLGFAVTNAL